jgi:16S rRNA (cytosine1402-N4)-methyltransferase
VPFHVPVLREEVRAALSPALARENAVLVDATCGVGGHASDLARSCGPSRLVLLDRDPAAIAHVPSWSAGLAQRVDARHTTFSRLAEVLAELGLAGVDAILADLGVSSPQLDIPERGFSLRADGPLDMRMDPTRGVTAADFVANAAAEELVAVLREYGEEPHARRIASALIEARPRTTGALARLVQRVVPRRPGQRIDPATRTFQALRIAVNDELGELDALLREAPDLLVVGGRLAIISFHSLEDRRVKRRFAELTAPAPVPRHLPVREVDRTPVRWAYPGRGRAIRPTAAEVESNARSRSARLRVIERIAA